MSHIFGKGNQPPSLLTARASRKDAIRDAAKMQQKFEDMQRALARTMHAAEYMGKILDENGFNNRDVSERIQNILSGRCDEEILKAAKLLKVDENGVEGSNTEGIRESLPGALPTSGGEGGDRTHLEGEECGDRQTAVDNSSTHERPGKDFV